jgi:hypothetical protein
VTARGKAGAMAVTAGAVAMAVTAGAVAMALTAGAVTVTEANPPSDQKSAKKTFALAQNLEVY